MSLTVSVDLIDATKTAQLKTYRDSASHTASHIRADQEFVIDTSKLDADGLGDIIDAANSINDKKTARAVESILLARSGVFDRPVPNFKAFQGMLEAFLKKNCTDNGRVFDVVTDGTPLDTARKLEADLIALALNEVMDGFRSCGTVYETKELYEAISYVAAAYQQKGVRREP